MVEATDAVAPHEKAVFGELNDRMNEMLSHYSNGELHTIRHYLEDVAQLTDATAPSTSERSS
jgi:hypothetical protein